MKTLGGVPILFLNIYDELKSVVNFGFIIYKNSEIYELLTYRNIDHILFLDNNLFFNSIKKIENNDIIVITTISVDIIKIFPKNPYLIFWVVFPETIIEIFKISFIKNYYLARKFIYILNKYNAIYVMDDNCNKHINNYYKCTPPYLPIPVKIIENKYLLKNHSNILTTNFSYIGRAQVWKIRPLIKLLIDLDKILLYNTFFYIYTDDAFSFKKALKDLTIEHIKLCFIEKFHIDKIIDHMLDNNVNLNFAMGTSALDTAKVGIPTILIDATYSKLPDNYKYLWLFDTQNYNLGSIIDSNFSNFAERAKHINMIMYDLITDNINISNKCYNYIFNHHNIIDISKSFINYSGISNLKYDNILFAIFVKFIRVTWKKIFHD